MSTPQGELAIMTAQQHALEHRLDETCRFKFWMLGQRRWTPSNAPEKLAQRLIAMPTAWSEIPILTRTVQAPTLRPDGTVLQKPGYDPQTGILFDPGGVKFPAIPESPTHEEGLAALKKVTDLLSGFPFVNDASLSVAVSKFITPLIRPACRAVPLHAVTAPKRRSGKTTLATLASYIATGRPPALLTRPTARPRSRSESSRC